jgi:hypothetical protein
MSVSPSTSFKLTTKLLALLITFQNSPYTAADNVDKNYIQSQFAIKKIKNTRWPNFAKAKINLDKPTIQDQYKKLSEPLYGANKSGRSRL